MEEYRICIDGMTINRSIDLLESSSEAEVAYLRTANQAYHDALHQLVSAAIFADRLMFDKAIVRGSIQRDNGIEFMERLNKYVSTANGAFVVPDEIPPPLGLLSDPAAMKRIQVSLAALRYVTVGNRRHETLARLYSPGV